MTKRPILWSLVGLLLLLFLCNPSTAWAEHQSPWMWPAEAGQWIGDQFEKGGNWIEKKLGIDDAEEPPPKPTPKHNQKLIDALVPPTKEQMGRIKVMHQQYPLSHYQLDYVPKQTKFWNVRDQLMDLLAACAHEFNNSVWNINVAGSRLVIWLLTHALSLDIVTDLSDQVGEGLKRLAGMEGASVTERGIYGLLLPLMVVIGGLWLGYKALLQEDEDGAT